MAIPITETFDNSFGRLTEYDTYDVLEYQPLLDRAHINLRSFSTTTSTGPIPLYALQLTMSEANSESMQDLTTVSTGSVEPWDFGAIGADPAYANRNTLRLSLSAGLNAAQSVGEIIDITDVPDDWSLSISLPNFPGTQIDRMQSFFDIGTLVLPLTALPTTDGSVELTWPRSALPDQFSTLRFRLLATAATTVTVAAIRLLSPKWTDKTMDIDTRTKRYAPTFTRTGSIPTAAPPHMWRASASTPGGADDPRPVNSKIGVNFFTGSMQRDNRIQLYFRGRREDFLTQLDLDGTDPGVVPAFGENMASLNERKRQPDYGQARYDPRPQSDLETLPQSNLDVRSQADLERLIDTISAAWIKVTLDFGLVNTIELATTETQNDDERYTWNHSLAPNTAYSFLVDVVDSSVRIRLYLINSDNSIETDAAIFDSTAVRNDFLFKRRRGRIGWQANFNDGDAWIESVRSRGQMYGEIMTNSFESFTPVVGARIFSGNTPDQTIIPGTSAFNSTIAADTRISRSPDGSVRVTASVGQGIQTDYHVFEDFANTEIFFDLYTSAGGADKFTAGLLNEKGLLIPLTMTHGYDNRWQTFRIYATSAENQMTGKYRFVLLQSVGQYTWWIDNLYFLERSVAYSARSEALDPWGRGGNNWIDFKSLVNNDNNGAMFATRGNFVQVKAQALKQGVTIDKIYVKPQYAQLGRFAWNS